MQVSTGELLKVSIASSLGIAFEFYDFLIFGYAAPVLASLFFPVKNALLSLLYTFISFATGFAGRPLGAIVFGHLGDKIGRKYTLVFTISLMGLASVALAVLPTYYQIGIWAPILLTVFRFLQGFSLGGEFGGGITLTGEFAPTGSRAMWLGVAQTAQGSGPLLATGLMTLFLLLYGQKWFASIGWRIMFGIGAIIAIIGVYIRLRISESPVFMSARSRGQISRLPLVDAFRAGYWKRILNGLGFIIGGTAMTYTTGVFAVSYLTSVLHVPSIEATIAVSMGYVVLIIFSPIFGMLADRYGRKPFMIAYAVGTIAFVYPYFLLLTTKSFPLIILAQVVYNFMASWFNGAYISELVEMFPTRVRYTALSFIYHVGVAAFGGTTPFIATYLIYVTHYTLAPVYWALAAMVITLIAFILAPETRGTDVNY
ncbi:MFS transporter [Vulcanisaeta thermophila]|uniref:MFS transporter n=1 Tax=Vulcanisaeta thermophila TaxID=867917 RepID=UPI0008537690|nr:MFS transporter [Vulcanisaeta thermophila]